LSYRSVAGRGSLSSSRYWMILYISCAVLSLLSFTLLYKRVPILRKPCLLYFYNDPRWKSSTSSTSELKSGLWPASISLFSSTIFSSRQSVSYYIIKTIHYYLTNWINGYLIVPILPHYIHHNHQEFSSNDTLKENDHLFEIGRGYYHPDMGDNSRLGLLLSLKAIVQLGANPIVALLCNRLSSGFTFPLIAGTVNIIGCSLRKKI